MAPFLYLFAYDRMANATLNHLNLLTTQGHFEILTLSGSYTISDAGGGVAGQLMVASPIQVVVGIFLPNGLKPQKKRHEAEPRNCFWRIFVDYHDICGAILMICVNCEYGNYNFMYIGLIFLVIWVFEDFFFIFYFLFFSGFYTTLFKRCMWYIPRLGFIYHTFHAWQKTLYHGRFIPISFTTLFYATALLRFLSVVYTFCHAFSLYTTL